MGLKLTRIINKIRLATQNDDPGSDLTGITDEAIINFLNDAQDRLMSRVLSTHPNLYVVEKEYNITASTESYEIPFDAFMSGRIHSVEYSSSASGDDFYELRVMSYKNRQSDVEGAPSFYFRRNNKVFLHPTPDTSNGRLRINYVRRLPDVGDILATVTSSTADSDGITAMTLTGVGTGLTTLDTNYDHLTIVDAFGTVIERNIAFSSVHTTTGVVTLSPAQHDWESSQVTINGYNVVGGRYSSTHVDLPDNAERYLVAYGKWQILKMDSSEDASEAAEELAAIERDYVESIADLDDDLIDIPELESYEEIW